MKQLQDLGVAISSGRLSQFITDGLDVFHDEKDQLLQAGLSVSQYVQADDTGERHDGKNGYGTHPSTKLRAGIGNELFAWFSSTENKSRINFLSCLGQGIPVNFSIVSDDAGPLSKRLGKSGRPGLQRGLVETCCMV